MTLALPFPREPVQIALPERKELWQAAMRGRDIRIPSVPLPRDPERRQRARKDLFFFTEKYFPKQFFKPEQYHVDELKNLQRMTAIKAPVVLYDAKAGPRSTGKTAMIRFWVMWFSLERYFPMALWIGNKGPNAESRVSWMKNELLTNDLLAEDYPEICNWVRSFNGDPRRCGPNYSWSDDRIKLRNGVWTLARGIDSALSGLNEDGIRPRVIIYDDLETIYSVRSATETETIRQAFYTECLGLHDINATAVHVFRCNVRRNKTLSSDLTDPRKNPSWGGRRDKAIIKFPDRMDLWEKFLAIHKGDEKAPPECADVPVADVCNAALLNGEPMPVEVFELYKFGHQNALRLYTLHKAEMDAGAEIFDSIRLPLHVLFDNIAVKGWEFFYTEFQNEAPEDEDANEKQLSITLLELRRVPTCPRALVPDWGEWVLCTIDMGQSYIHWEADAWNADLSTDLMIEEGVKSTEINKDGQYKLASLHEQPRLVHEAIWRSLSELNTRLSMGWHKGGEILRPRLVGVDIRGTAGTHERFAWQETVLKFCYQHGWIPMMGMPEWKEPVARRAGGRNWIREKENNPFGRIDWFAAYFKLMMAQACQLPLLDDRGLPFRGTRLFHAETSIEYFRQLTAEKYIETILEDREVQKTIDVKWIPSSGERVKNNHWFDTSGMQYALADMLKSLVLGLPARAAAPVGSGPVLPSWHSPRERF